MGARRFSPDTGRFLQPDVFQGALANLGLSMDPLSGNRYALASGNPISFVEWDGHMLQKAHGGGTKYTPEDIGWEATRPPAETDDGGGAGPGSSFASWSLGRALDFWGEVGEDAVGVVNGFGEEAVDSVSGLCCPGFEAWSNCVGDDLLRSQLCHVESAKTFLTNFDDAIVASVEEAVGKISAEIEAGNPGEAGGRGLFMIGGGAIFRSLRLLSKADAATPDRALLFADDVMRANVNKALDDIDAGVSNYPQDFGIFSRRRAASAATARVLQGVHSHASSGRGSSWGLAASVRRGSRILLHSGSLSNLREDSRTVTRWTSARRWRRHLEPSSPWLHLIDVFEPAIATAASGLDFRLYRLDLAGVHTKAELMEAVADEFALPDYFGRNWDALIDVIGDLSWAPAEGYVVVAGGLDGLVNSNGATFVMLVRALLTAVLRMHRSGRSMHLLFVGEAVRDAVFSTAESGHEVCDHRRLPG